MNQSLSKINTACLLILAASALTVGLIHMRSVLEPLVFALFYYVVALPFVSFAENKLKMPRLIAVIFTTLTAGLVMAALVAMITASIGSFVAEADAYQQKVIVLTEQSSQFLERNGLHMNPEKVRQEILKFPIFNMVGGLTTEAFNFIGNFFLILIIFFFLIIGGTVQSDKSLLQLELENKISRYVISKTVISVITGGFAWLILVLFGVELAVLFAVVTFFLNFIPNIGPVIATLIPLPIALLQYGFGGTFFAVTLMLGTMHMISGNVVEPKMMGESLELHPITIMVFLLFWGVVWGISGMFLAVPITAILKIILSKIEFTKPVAEMMEGRVFKKNTYNTYSS